MKTPKALILNRRDIASLMSMSDYLQAVEDAFRRAAEGRMLVPDVVHIAAADGAFHVKSAAFKDDSGYVAVKVNGNFPANPRQNGLPTIQGAIVLCSGVDGSLLAIIDSAEVTAMRTAAATAVAARYLVRRRDANVATIIGCGVQGALQLQALLEVLPIEMVYLYDLDRQRGEALVERIAAQGKPAVRLLTELSVGTRSSQVIVTATSSRTPFLGRDQVMAGTFIAAVGADNHDKQELEAELLAESSLVVDVLEQCAGIGELHHALSAGLMTRNDVVADLGSIVAGLVRLDFNDDAVIVFDSTGTATQDVAAAGVIYERALQSGAGIALELS